MDATGRQKLKVRLLSVEDSRLLLGLLVFTFPFAVPGDASTYAIDGLISLHLKGPDGHIENPFSFWKKDADRSAVDTSRSLLCLLDDFHSGDLRCACDRATRKEGLEGLEQIDFGSQATFNGRRHLPNGGVLLDLAEAGHLLTSNF